MVQVIAKYLGVSLFVDTVYICC